MKRWQAAISTIAMPMAAPLLIPKRVRSGMSSSGNAQPRIIQSGFIFIAVSARSRATAAARSCGVAEATARGEAFPTKVDFRAAFAGMNVAPAGDAARVGPGGLRFPMMNS